MGGLLALLVASLGMAQDIPPLVIGSVTVDTVSGALTITGVGFSDDVEVWVDGQRLQAEPGGSATQIVAVAPASILAVPGTYRLTLVDRRRQALDSFAIAVPVPPAAAVLPAGGEAATSDVVSRVGRGPARPAPAAATLASDRRSVTTNSVEDGAPLYNTAFGLLALNPATVGYQNVGIGYAALYGNTSGADNVAAGLAALYANTSGNLNLATGYQALSSNTTGSENVAVGAYALNHNTSGSRNIAMGFGALYSAPVGLRNVAIGYNAGAWAGVSDNVYLASPGEPGARHETGTIRIGSEDLHTKTFVAGIRGTRITETAPDNYAVPVIIGMNGQLGTADVPNTRFGIGVTASPAAVLHLQTTTPDRQRLLQIDEPASANTGLFLEGAAGDNTFAWYGVNYGEKGGFPLLTMNRATGDVGTGPLTVGLGSRNGPSLRIQGDAVSDGTGQNWGSYGSFLLNADSASSGGARRFLVTNALNASAFGIIRSTDAVTDPGLGTAGAVAAGTVDFAISNTGNVGIGTATPTKPLEMGSGAHVTAGGVWTDASSRSLKQDIADLPLETALDAVKGLTPVTYAYKANPSEHHVGFIAEDVPALVATPDRTSLSPMDIVAVLTKVVQAQQRALVQKDEDLAALKAQNLRRDARLAALEEQVERLLRPDTAPGK